MLFISHSHKDREFAIKLAIELNRQGYEVWIDKISTNLGDPLWDEIQKAIKSCDTFIALASTSALNSESVKREIDIATDRGIDEIQIISILIGGTKGADLPTSLSKRLYLNKNNSPQQLVGEMRPALKEPRFRSQTVALLSSNKGLLTHPLDSISGTGVEIKDVFIFDNSCIEVVERLYSLISNFRTLLAETMVNNPTYGRMQARDLDQLHDRTQGFKSILTDLSNDYLSMKNQEGPEALFRRTAYLSFMEATIEQSYYQLRKLELATSGVSGAPVNKEEYMKAGRFHDGLLVEIWEQGPCIKAICPSYVGEIDLPYGGTRLDAIAMPADAGRMVGSSLGHAYWTNHNYAKLISIINLPKLHSLKVGLA